MQTVAVLGARGRLGRVVARAFLARNWRVIAVTRDGAVPLGLAGAETRAADAMDRQALVNACAGADVIFNGLNPAYTRWSEQCPVLAENVLAAARACGALHLFAGNVYNYGPVIPQLVDDATPMAGGTRKGDIRNAMERAFEAAARDDGPGHVSTTVLRAGDFYGGDGTGSWFDLAVTSKVEKNVFTWPGGTGASAMHRDHAWAYLPDLARAFVALAENGCDEPGFQTYTFAGHTLSGAAMKTHIEEALGRRLKPAGIPWWLIRAGGVIAPMWRELAEISYLWFRPHRLSGAKLEAAVGPLPATEPALAVAKALADLGLSDQSRAAA